MFSKAILKKMVQEVSLPVLLSMFQDYVEQLPKVEEITEPFMESISNVEIFLTEIKRRSPASQPATKRPRTSAAPTTESPKLIGNGGDS